MPAGESILTLANGLGGKRGQVWPDAWNERYSEFIFVCAHESTGVHLAQNMIIIVARVPIGSQDRALVRVIPLHHRCPWEAMNGTRRKHDYCRIHSVDERLRTRRLTTVVRRFQQVGS